MINAEEALLKPLPIPDGDTTRFWNGLARGELLLQHCLDCAQVHYYQQGLCRFCGSERLEHRPASGRGRVYSYSVVYRAPGPAFRDDTPYAVLLVELEEGPRMISSLVGGDPERVTIGMPVQLVCEKINDEITLPRFRPA
jgi:uncharacterized OB-fold protein